MEESQKIPVPHFYCIEEEKMEYQACLILISNKIPLSKKITHQLGWKRRCVMAVGGHKQNVAVYMYVRAGCSGTLVLQTN